MYNPKEDSFAPLNSVGGFEGAAADGNGFSDLIHTAVDKGYLSIVAKRRYCHRYSVTGEPLYNVVVVAVKNATLHSRGYASNVTLGMATSVSYFVNPIPSLPALGHLAVMVSIALHMQ